MMKKKIIIVMLMLMMLILICMASVSANENIINESMKVNDEVEIAVSQDENHEITENVLESDDAEILSQNLNHNVNTKMNYLTNTVSVEDNVDKSFKSNDDISSDRLNEGNSIKDILGISTEDLLSLSPSGSFSDIYIVQINSTHFHLTGSVSLTTHASCMLWGKLSKSVNVFNDTTYGVKPKGTYNIDVIREGSFDESSQKSMYIGASPSDTTLYEFSRYEIPESHITYFHETETTVTVNDVNLVYNNGTFSVSGTVKAGSDNVNGGTVTVTIGSTTKTATVSNGVWTASGFSSTSWDPSSQSISASYGGVSGSYKSSSGSGTLTINRNTPSISINSVSPTYNGGSYTVSGKVSVTDNKNIVTTNGLTLTVGTRTYTVNVGSDGSWSVNDVDSTLLAPGSRSIEAKYVGNTYYNTKTQSQTITVNKNTPTITINNIDTVTYNGNTYTISGTAIASGSNSGLTSGTITLKTNTGVTLTGTTSWSSGTWYVNGISSTLLNPGTYAVTATYSSNDYYNEASSSLKSLTVNKMTSEVIVTGNPNFKYNINTGQLISGQISNTINGKYGGYVNITIGGVLVKSNVAVNSDGTWSFTNYDTGRFLPKSQAYTITVSYSGNDFNYDATGTGTYTVTKGDSIPIIVSGGDINGGDNKTIKVTVRDSKGFVKDSNVVLKGKGLPAEGLKVISDGDGEAVFSVSGLTKGFYDDWIVSIVEDDRYVPLFDQKVEAFYVKQALDIIITNVNPYTSTYPDKITIKGKTSASDNPNGNVNITLGDKTVTAALVNNQFTVTFDGVLPGEYDAVSAVFIPDADEHSYGGHVEDVNLDNKIVVNKYLPVISISNVSIHNEHYPGIVSVSFKLIGVAGDVNVPTGRVEIIHDGRVCDSVVVGEDETYTLQVERLPSGVFSLTLKYYGDDYYMESVNSTEEFNIKPYSILDFNDNPYDVVTHSIVNVSSNMNDRQIMVYLDGNYYDNITIRDDKSIIDLGVLSYGNHTVNVMFEGDESYVKLYKSHVIFVDKLKSKVNVSASSVRTGNPVIVNVNASGNGSANIVIFNATKIFGSYNITINNGKGSFIVPIDFVNGSYNLNITYSGDEIYHSNFNSTTFNVHDRIQSSIVFIEPDYIVNQTIILNVSSNFPSGNLTVYIDGKKQDNIVQINSNEASINLGVLSAGNHTVIVMYAGDYDFTDLNTDITFDVLKLQTAIDIDVKDEFYVDDLVEILVSVNKSCTGYVNVNVNNKDYRLKIVDGLSKLNLTHLENASYNIHAQYLGDDYFYTNTTNKEFSVNKIPVNVVLPEHIIVGDDLYINFTNPHVSNSEIAGVLNITVGPKSVNVFVVNGTCIIPLSKLPEIPDNYDVAANYSGNYKFASTILNTKLIIEKLTTHTVSVNSNVTIDDDLTVTVNGDRGYMVDGNLTVSVNGGESFIVPVHDGVAVISYDQLPQITRDNTLIINYGDGTFYADKAFEVNVHSDKVTDYEFNIKADSIRFGENGTLMVNLPEDVNATLTVKINDIDYTVKITDGVGVLPGISGLHALNNTVESTFSSLKYETSTAVTGIWVNPNDMTLIITVPSEQLYVDETANINIKANVSCNVPITVYINGRAETMHLVNGEVNFNISPLIYGDYVLTAIFEGDENYTRTYADEKSFHVNKINSSFIITPQDIFVSENEIITLTIDDNVTGSFSIDINGTKYTAAIDKGIAILNISDLKYGNYIVTAVYGGDHKYLPSTNTSTFTVNKNPIGEIKVKSDGIYENKAIVTVTVPYADATGLVIITVNNNNFSAKLLDGRTQIEVADLNSVENSFDIVYVGDDKYLSNKTKGFIVDRGIFIESFVNVTATSVMVDEKTFICVDVVSDATGFVVVSVDGRNIQLPLVDAAASFELGDLLAGEHTVIVKYLGDEKYYNSTNSSTFHIYKYESSINVSAADGIAGVPTTVCVVANVSANGNVSIVIDGVNYTAVMVNGVASLDVVVNRSGNKTILATFEGDPYYNVSSAVGYVHMDSASVSLIVSADDINVGSDAIITVTLSDDATGNVSIAVNDKNYNPVSIVDGIAKFNITGLVADNYHVVAYYPGNSKYEGNSNETDFKVNKIDVSPSKGNDTQVNVVKNPDGSSTINITVPDDATGNITVNVNGKNHTVPIVNGTASITENIGENSNVSVTYPGDDKYTGFNETVKITSEGVKFTPEIIITSKDIEVGQTAEITVDVPVDATGNIVLTVNGKTYTGNINNGTSIFNVDALANGTYVISATYNGDKKYLKTSNTTNITVNKLELSIIASSEDIFVGETAIIIVNVPSDATGNILVEINNKTYNGIISNGNAKISITALTEGTYDAHIVYEGDAKYLGNFNDTSFKVSKNTIDPVGGNKTQVISENNTKVIVVTVPEDATGNVTVIVDGKEYTVPVTNGTARVNVDNYNNNSNVSVIYSGDDKYNGFNESVKITDDIVKYDVNLEITSDKSSYIAGETSIISVVLPNDAKGNVTLKVNNNIVNNVSLVNGNAVFEYIIPYGGDFIVEAVFDGDEKYGSVSNSTAFWAVKSNSTICIKVNDTAYDKNATVIVVVPEDATGNVTISIVGNNYTSEVFEGKAVFILPLLDRDTYEITAKYDGDAKYNPNDTKSSFQVINKDSGLNVNATSIIYGDVANVTVNLANEATGYITVTSGNDTYFAFIENGSAKVSIPDLNPGLNNITVYYSGDEEYQKVTVDSVIPVARLSSNTQLLVDNIDEGDDLNVTVIVTSGATGEIVITIAGKNYTGVISDGIAVINVSGLSPGNYTISALYSGDRYYNESFDNGSFSVKANITVFAYEMSRGYNSGLDYSVMFTDNFGYPLANRDVVISVGGVDYTVKTDSNGVARLNVKLPVGDHTVSMINPVTGEETHSNLTIAARLIENRNVVTDYNSGYLYKVRVIGDDGNPVGAGVKFTVPINGKKYTFVTDKNGYITIKIDKRFKASVSKNKLAYKLNLSYKGYTIHNTITIKQVLKTKKVVKVKKSAKKLVLKATLKWSDKKPIKGKVVKFKFKGKTYKAKTNKKGVAKVVIKKKVLKKLKLGKNYKVKVTYLTDTVKSWVKYRK